MKIATVEGYWSTNIGNALFQISAQEIFKSIGADVIVVPDLPGYINVARGNPSDYFEFMDKIDCDYFCVHGPLFRKESKQIIIPLLARLVKRGVKIIGLGVGAMHYDEATIRLYQKWFEDIPWHFISTRDERTYNFLKRFERIETLHNGIDLGFFISRFRPQPQLKGDEKIVCLNFDQIPEPKFLASASGVLKIGSDSYTYRKTLSAEPRGWLKKIWPFILPYFKSFSRTSFNEFDVVRLDHRFNPYSRRKIYHSPSGFGMDTPAGYLLAYANSELTLSNRVHANVATLSYGGRSMYFSDSKRASLLERVGLADIYTRPMVIDQKIIDSELEAITLKLSRIL